jgi:electron transport complex protein RnfG
MTAPGSPLRAAALLGLAALLATALLTAIDVLTGERIEQRARALELERLGQVLPPARYDNDPLAATVVVQDPRLGPGPQRVHLGRLGGEPSALALTATAPDGYSGPIRLVIGIDRDGTVLGVRVLEHAETPGLGDPIEVRRGDWIRSFDGRSLDDPAPARWTVRRDGGAFDQFTGATITPRAVVQAVRRALEFHAAEHQRLYAASPPTPQRG